MVAAATVAGARRRAIRDQATRKRRTGATSPNPLVRLRGDARPTEPARPPHQPAQPNLPGQPSRTGATSGPSQPRWTEPTQGDWGKPNRPGEPGRPGQPGPSGCARRARPPQQVGVERGDKRVLVNVAWKTTEWSGEPRPTWPDETAGLRPWLKPFA